MPNPRVTKTCRGCGEEAEHHTQKRGERLVPLSRCVTCENARKKAWNAANREKRRERDQRYERSEQGRRSRAEWKRTEPGRAKARRQALTRAVDPDKIRARSAVRRAVMECRVIPPRRCARCYGRPTPHGGNARGLVAHHKDGYQRENWLSVEWICVPCHKREHGAYADHEPDTSTWATWAQRRARDQAKRQTS